MVIKWRRTGLKLKTLQRLRLSWQVKFVQGIRLKVKTSGIVKADLNVFWCRVFNFKLGCFVLIHILNCLFTRPHLKLGFVLSAKVLSMGHFKLDLSLPAWAKFGRTISKFAFFQKIEFARQKNLGVTARIVRFSAMLYIVSVLWNALP